MFIFGQTVVRFRTFRTLVRLIHAACKMAKTDATILIIDDDEDILLSAKLLLKKHYSKVLIKDTPKELNQLLSSEPIDVIVLDMNYRIGFNDGKEGMYWLRHILDVRPEMVVILMTAYGEVELAVNAIKKGAFDFILKPWTNEKFLATIQAGLKLSKSRNKVTLLTGAKEVLEKDIDQKFGPIVGKSKEMMKLMEVVDKVSDR